VKPLGAVSDEHDFIATEVADRFASDVTNRCIRALQSEFGEKSHVLLDYASYFESQQMHDFVEETQIEVPHFPRGSSNLTPVEECRHQLKRSPGGQFFGSVGELRPAVITAHHQIDLLNIHDHL
jgi:hypothetical protein